MYYFYCSALFHAECIIFIVLLCFMLSVLFLLFCCVFMLSVLFLLFCCGLMVIVFFIVMLCLHAECGILFYFQCRSNECRNAECCGTKRVYSKFDFNQTKKKVFFSIKDRFVCLCFKTVSRNICISRWNKLFTLVIFDHNKAALLSCSFAIGMGLTKLFIGLNCLSILMAELST